MGQGESRWNSPVDALEEADRGARVEPVELAGGVS